MRGRGTRSAAAARTRWTVCVLVGVLLAALCAAVGAAKVRSGSASDPRDAGLADSQDIQSAQASYNDLTGAFSIAVQFYGALTVPADAASTPILYVDFGPQTGIACGTARPNGAIFTADTNPNTMGVIVSSPRLTQVASARKTVSADRRTIGISYTNKALGGMDLRCAQVYVRTTTGSFDQLDQPILFAGPFTTPVCTVPKVVKKTLAEAKRSIDAGGCSMGKVTRVRSRLVAKGRVVAQRPAAGRKLVFGSLVALSVSRGRR